MKWRVNSILLINLSSLVCQVFDQASLSDQVSAFHWSHVCHSHSHSICPSVDSAKKSRPLPRSSMHLCTDDVLPTGGGLISILICSEASYTILELCCSASSSESHYTDDLIFFVLKQYGFPCLSGQYFTLILEHILLVWSRFSNQWDSAQMP